MTRALHIVISFVGLTAGCLLVLGFAGGQDGPFGGKQKKEKRSKDENGKRETDRLDHESKAILKSAEKAFRGGGGTERDKWIEEMRKVYQGQASAGQTRDDFAQWYTLLAGDATVWQRNQSPKKVIAELFDRAAGRLGFGDVESIRRDDFLAYAQKFLAPESSPPWKDPLANADKVYRELDRDQSGFLESAEWSESLAGTARIADSNSDGRIDYPEYRRYFENRVSLAIETGATRQDSKRDRVEMPALPTFTGRPNDPITEPKPGVAVRFGKLPPGLPDWFETLDTNFDAQIALHEWRKGGKTIEEFELMDLDDDGLLTPDEWLRYDRDRMRMNPPDPPTSTKKPDKKK